jgi:hypothetical protein
LHGASRPRAPRSTTWRPDHQLAALIGHVALEHRFEAGVDLEQSPIKERRHIVGNRGDDGERPLNKLNLGDRRHWNSSL